MELTIRYGIKLNLEQLLDFSGKEFQKLIKQAQENPSLFPLDDIDKLKVWETPDYITEKLFDYDEANDSWTFKEEFTTKHFPYNWTIGLVKFSGYKNGLFLIEIFRHLLKIQSISEVDNEYVIGVDIMTLDRSSLSGIVCLTDLINDPPKEAKEGWQRLLKSEIFQANPKIASQSPKIYLIWDV